MRKPDGDAVTAEEMEHGIRAAGHELAAGDIVLVHTGRDAFYGERDYMLRGCGVTPRPRAG
jgi:Putative cyclase